jgi:hypothetical protein
MRLTTFGSHNRLHCLPDADLLNLPKTPTRYLGTAEVNPARDADTDMDPEYAKADSAPSEASAGVKGDVLPRPRPRRPRPVPIIRYTTDF